MRLRIGLSFKCLGKYIAVRKAVGAALMAFSCLSAIFINEAGAQEYFWEQSFNHAVGARFNWPLNVTKSGHVTAYTYDAQGRQTSRMQTAL